MLVGGNGPRVLDRVLAFGDEWMPNRVGDERDHPALRGAGPAGRGGGPGPIPITVAGMMRDPRRIERFERAGVHRGLFWLPATNRDEVEQAFERYTAAAQEYDGAGA